MNLGQMTEEVLAHGFSAARYRTRVQTWLNVGQQRVAALIDAPTLRRIHEVELVPGQASYQFAPAASVVRVERVVREDGWVLVPHEDLAAVVGIPTAGPPVAYAIRDTPSQITFLPTPQDEGKISVIVYTRPPQMVANDDEPIIDPRYHDLLISFALQRAYRSEDDPSQAAFYQSEFERDLRIYASDVNFTTADGPVITPGTWG